MYDLNKYSFSVTFEANDSNKGEYVVIFNDCPNIIGVGDSVEEAIEEARGNLDAYLEFCEEEGIEKPEPSKFEWMQSYNGKITLRMPKSLHREIAEYAKKDGSSLNSIINDAVRVYLTNSFLKETKDSACLEIGNLATYFENFTKAYPDVVYKTGKHLFQNRYSFAE